jgi:rubrerythrin
MNFLNILNKISETDPEVFERTSQRRDVIKNLTKGVTVATLPFVTGAIFNKAYGQTGGGMNTVLDVLNFALTLEYLEAEFYNRGLAASNLIPAGTTRNGFQTLANHENAHVAFLRAAITGAGGTPVAKPTFDFSGGNGSNNGPFATAFTNYDLFLAISQTFEDTGVRAYKGQAANLMSNNEVLTAALNIHSVEARHAAFVREVRKARGGSLVVGDVRPWIIGNQSNIANAAVQPSYNGEQVTTQAGINIVNINGQQISAEDASGAFDEPLTKEQVLAIVDPFIA